MVVSHLRPVIGKPGTAQCAPAILRLSRASRASPDSDGPPNKSIIRPAGLRQRKSRANAKCLARMPVGAGRVPKRDKIAFGVPVAPTGGTPGGFTERLCARPMPCWACCCGPAGFLLKYRIDRVARPPTWTLKKPNPKEVRNLMCKVFGRTPVVLVILVVGLVPVHLASRRLAAVARAQSRRRVDRDGGRGAFRIGAVADQMAGGARQRLLRPDGGRRAGLSSWIAWLSPPGRNASTASTPRRARRSGRMLTIACTSGSSTKPGRGRPSRSTTAGPTPWARWATCTASTPSPARCCGATIAGKSTRPACPSGVSPRRRWWRATWSSSRSAARTMPA